MEPARTISLGSSDDFNIARKISISVWLIDASRQLPATCLDGFDISTRQLPLINWSVANVSLKSLDIISSIPDELFHIYDIVRVRLFLSVIRDGDQRPVLNNILTMLS